MHVRGRSLGPPTTSIATIRSWMLTVLHSPDLGCVFVIADTDHARPTLRCAADAPHIIQSKLSRSHVFITWPLVLISRVSWTPEYQNTHKEQPTKKYSNAPFLVSLSLLLVRHACLGRTGTLLKRLSSTHNILLNPRWDNTG